MRKEASYLYDVLGHPIRRNIIRILGERGNVAFTELKDVLNVSVGALYYNLDLLEGFVTQDVAKRYILTKQGEMTYRFLLESEERIVALGLEVEMRKGWIKALSKMVMAWDLFTSISRSPMPFSPLAILILVYGGAITYQARLIPLIFLYSEKPVFQPIFIPLFFIFGWTIINILGNIIPLLLFNRPKEGARSLLVGSCYALLPSLLFPTLWVVCKTFFISLSLTIAQIVMLICMLFSLCFLTTAISTAKGLRIEKAATVTTITLYIAICMAVLLLRF